MFAKSLFIIVFLHGLSIQQQSSSKIGFAYSPNPDVIKCDDYFYYLMTTSPTKSTYNAFSDSLRKLESYDVSNGVLSNKVGSLPGNCENQTIKQLWAINRAYRLFNLDRAPNRSIDNNDKYPDVLQCQNGNLLYRSFKSSSSIKYQNPTGKNIEFNSFTNTITPINIKFGSKSLSALVTESKTYKIATQVSSAATPSVSMAGKYPDFLKCKLAELYIYSLNQDQTMVIYRTISPPISIQLQFLNGNYKSSKIGFLIDDCTNKSISDLVKEGKAFNLNTPILECPSDITSNNPVVSFNAISTGSLNLSYSHQSNTSFPVGQATTVTVRATHNNFNINLQCKFMINILSPGSGGGSDDKMILGVSIVAGAIALAGVIIGTIVLIWCRKYKRACFKAKEKVSFTKTQNRMEVYETEERVQSETRNELNK